MKLSASYTCIKGEYSLSASYNCLLHITTINKLRFSLQFNTEKLVGRIPIKMTLNIVKTEFQVKRLTFATEQAPHMKQTDDQKKNSLFL